MIIKQLLFDRVKNEYVSERLVESPAPVEFNNVESWLSARFGPALDVAYTDDERGGRVAIGWTFELPEDIPADGPRSNYEIVMIPMVTEPGTGNLVSAFDRQAAEKREFEQLAAEGLIDTLIVVKRPSEPWEPPTGR